jgi:hypothetical protein
LDQISCGKRNNMYMVCGGSSDMIFAYTKELTRLARDRYQLMAE